MADTRKGLYLEPDWIPALLQFAPSELGRLIRCALTYTTTGTETDLPGKERVLWPYIQAQIDQSNILYTVSNNISSPGYTVSDSSLISGKEKDKEDIKEKEAKKKKAEEKKKTDIFDEFEYQHFNYQWGGDLSKALHEFEAHRKETKHPMSDEAKKRLLSKLEKFPKEQWIPILDQSILNGWQDIYPLKEDKPQQPAKPKQYTTAAEYQRPTKIDVSALERIKADFGLKGGA